MEYTSSFFPRYFADMVLFLMTESPIISNSPFDSKSYTAEFQTW